MREVAIGAQRRVELWQNRAVVSILRNERHVVEHFREAGATSPARAKRLDDVHERLTLALRRLRKRAVIREVTPDHFYLDEEVWQALGRTRRRVSIAVLALIVLLIVAVFAVRQLIAPSPLH